MDPRAGVRRIENIYKRDRKEEIKMVENWNWAHGNYGNKQRKIYEWINRTGPIGRK